MEALFHQTSVMLEQVPHHFMRLERCSVENNDAHTIENDILSLLDSVFENCARLDFLVNKEPPSRRRAAKSQVDQLKYDCQHYRTSVQNIAHQRRLREQELRQREELMTKTFSYSDSNTTIMIDESLRHHARLNDVHKGVDELLGSGSSVLDGLREQRMTLKGAHKKILDMANTLGLSNTVMRLIEKRAYRDKYVLFGGMILTCICMLLVYKYLM